MSDLEEYEAEWRAKYKAADLKAMANKGHAMKNDNGDPSYPIGDVSDLKKAIMAVGRGGADHDAIRAHIIKNAARLGASNLIPDNWNSDGSLKQDNDAEEPEAQSSDASLSIEQLEGALGDAEKRRRKPRHRAMPLVPEYRRGEGIQVRRFDLTDSGLEVRESSDGSLIEITGSPIRYNAPYSVRDAAGEFEETMMPGVAAQLLASPGDLDCRFLFNHDGLPLARTTSGTLNLTDSPTGLMMSAHLDPRQNLAQDLAIAIQRGDVSQMSCGFIVADDDWTDDNGNPTSAISGTQRSIHRFDALLDVSAVTYPASPTTSIDVATRMLLEQPVESRARIRSLWTFAANEARSGSPMDSAAAENIQKLSQSMLGALDASEADEPEEERTASPCPQCGGSKTCAACGGSGLAGPDGTQNAPDPSPASALDGTGSRDDDETKEARSDAPYLELQLELMRMRRPPQP